MIARLNHLLQPLGLPAIKNERIKADKDFSRARAQIKKSVQAFLPNIKPGIGRAIVAATGKLDAQQKLFLEKYIPQWTETIEGIDRVHTCGGPLTGGCSSCKLLDHCRATQLKWAVRIPHALVDNALGELSGSAIKVFLYLSRRANFNPRSNHFGRTWLSYAEIRERTGVRDVASAVQCLRNNGLIELTQTKHSRGGQVRTVNQFQVLYLRQMKRLTADDNGNVNGSRGDDEWGDAEWDDEPIQ